MAGDTHLYSAARILFPEYAEELRQSPSFSHCRHHVRQAIVEAAARRRSANACPEITEDTMPGELANIIAGRIAALYDFKGPNFVADAACASTMAAISAAIDGLIDHDYDAVLTGGIDANMSPSTFVKFCKIGALSATGTRPYADGADGFVMGEGAVTFLLKRLGDAERDGDKIYAVIRGLGGSSDGKGKGITAPNPVGQKLCVRRAWQNAGIVPCLRRPDRRARHIDAGRRCRRDSELSAKFSQNSGCPPARLRLGSVKSNIGHLKGAAGAAGILKADVRPERKGVAAEPEFQAGPIPISILPRSPFYVNTQTETVGSRTRAECARAPSAPSDLAGPISMS